MEESRIAQIAQESAKLYEQYRPQMDLLAKSPLVKAKKTMSEYDVYALGKQLKAFDYYKSICEADGSVGDLGRLPNIAYDVITVAYGASIIPAICSVQPVEEDAGVVFFKDIVANTTKGNITSGDALINPTSGQPIIPHGYANNVISGELFATGDGEAVEFTGTVAGVPLRPNTVAITLEDSSTVYAKDDGLGVIIGRGVDGTVNYTTGEVVLNFRTAPANSKKVYVAYQVNVELASSIPSIRQVWRSKQVICNIYALQGSIGLLQAFGVRKKFGNIIDDELATDLVTEMNAEISGDLIRKLVGAAKGNTNWNKIGSSQISEMEHRQSFQYAITDAEAVLSQNAGRGVITGLIGGTDFCRYIANQPQFSKIQDVTTIGPSIYGTYNGLTVVRVPDSNIIPSNQGLAYYKGASPFEAPAVYAPFMPLTVTSTLPGASNPLQNRKAAAVWAAVDVLVDNFITSITLTNNAVS